MRLASKLGSAVFLVAALFVSAIPAGATSGTPGYGLYGSQMAFASWLVREDGQAWLYFAAGMNQAPSDGPFMGFVGRAPCREVVHHGRSGLRCSGGARGRGLMPGDFFFDPLLDSATLTMDAKGKTHTISWEGRGKEAEPYFHQHSGPQIGAMAMLMMWRRSATTGRMFGQEMPPGRGSMFESIYADVWANALWTTDGVRLEMRGGELRVSKTFR